MLRIERILFPTDFSTVAEDAFSHAAHLAMQYDAEVYVFNVVTPQEADESNPMEYLPLQASDDRDGLYYVPSDRVSVETPANEEGAVRVVYGQIQSVSPAEAIIEQAESNDFDLIVMGTHGRRGIDRLLSGSVSEEVVRQAPCPVFTILAGEEPTHGPYVDRVLAPVDLSEQSAMVVDHAAELARTYDAPLDLLHVVEETAYPSAYGIDPVAPDFPDLQDRADEAMQELVARAQRRVGEVTSNVEVGYPAHEIVDFVKARDGAGLIVMATHGRTGLKRFVIGSVAEKVVRTSPCPVFTLKSFGRRLLPDAVTEGAGEA